MASYLVSFVRTGVPSAAAIGAPPWPPYSLNGTGTSALSLRLDTAKGHGANITVETHVHDPQW